MSEQTDIPQWAFDRAEELAGKVRTAHIALASYIAQHEEPPLDPLLIEAREIAAEQFSQNNDHIFSMSVREGRYDGCAAVLSALAGLRRGIEIGRQG